MWWLAGITRDVYIFSRSSHTHIRDIHVCARIADGSLGEGIVDVDLDIHSGAAIVKVNVEILQDDAGGLDCILAGVPHMPAYTRDLEEGVTPVGDRENVSASVSDANIAGSRIVSLNDLSGLQLPGARAHTPGTPVCALQEVQEGARMAGVEKGLHLSGARAHAPADIDLATQAAMRRVTTTQEGSEAADRVLNGLELPGLYQ
jgi:hypothetical protein